MGSKLQQSPLIELEVYNTNATMVVDFRNKK